MERDHRGGVVQEQEEVLDEGQEAVGWEEHALEPDLGGVAFAPIVGQKFPIK